MRKVTVGVPRKVGAVVCAAVLALALGGCGPSDAEVASNLHDSVQAQLSELGDMGDQALRDHFGGAFVDDLASAGIEPSKVFGPLFSQMSFLVGEAQVTGDDAIVPVSVTNIDVAGALARFSDTVGAELDSPESRDAFAAYGEAELVGYLTDVLARCMDDPTLLTVTTQVNLRYHRTDGAWQLTNGADLTQALLGGYVPQA